MQNLSHLTFGVELEAIFPQDFHTVAGRLSQLTGLNVTTGLRSGPVSRSSQNWTIVHDGSVSGSGYGGEIRSHILRGQDGIDALAKICRALVEIGASVNRSCGYHVHVGGFQPTLPFFKNLAKLYARYENAIDSIMPNSRRANNQHYARSLAARLDSRSLESATSIGAIIAAANGTGFEARYHKVNFTAYNKHSTVEFRQHAGTIEADKATNWVKICLRLVRAAEQGKTGVATGTPLTFTTLPVKARAVAEFITRPQGATAAEIRAAHPDFRALSVNRQARLAGLDVSARRERGRGEVFFAQANQIAETPATLLGLADLLQVAPVEHEYLIQRAATFAGAHA